MTARYHRRTLGRDVHFEGRGLHGGEPVRVTVHPGSAGIAFWAGQERTPARPDQVTDTSRCTRIGGVSTVEHMMSALAGLEITEAEIEVVGGEMPAFDGSASPIVMGLRGAGTVVLEEREIELPFPRIFQVDGQTKIAISRGEGHWRYQYEVAGRWPGAQSCERPCIVQGYEEEIASARTFALAEEQSMIEEYGLGRGLDSSSALVLGTAGYINEARFDDEPARHKMLDLMGDLYLAGIPLRFLNVTAERSGHRTNVAAAARLAASVTLQ